jgi:hypothetical protein
MIRKYYPMTVDEEATKYIGLTIQWDNTNRKVHTHMPGYLDKAFVRFNHEKPMKIQNSLRPHILPNYGAKTQYAIEEIDSPVLSKEDTKYIQAVKGTLLYNARAVNSPILTSQFNCNQASKTNKGNNDYYEATVRLLFNARGRNNHIQCK